MSWSSVNHFLANLQKEKGKGTKPPPDRECSGPWSLEENHSHLLKSRDVGDVVVPPLPLFLLQLDGDAAHSAPLQPLHQVGDKPGNLIVISALAFHPGISSLRTRGFSS